MKLFAQISFQLSRPPPPGGPVAALRGDGEQRRRRLLLLLLLPRFLCVQVASREGDCGLRGRRVDGGAGHEEGRGDAGGLTGFQTGQKKNGIVPDRPVGKPEWSAGHEKEGRDAGGVGG